jgi:transcriptional regulator with XRE-family HTH domain
VADDKKNPLGPTGDRVRSNVQRLRMARGMTKKDLSDATGRAGRAIPPLGISRIETGTRRVDADDLVALALALNVSPLTILLPATAEGDPAWLTSTYQIAEWAAWQWATGVRTASDWHTDSLVPPGAAVSDPAGEQEFWREQAEYKALAKPERLRRIDENRVIALANDFVGILGTLIVPLRGMAASVQRLQHRTAARLHAQLGYELEALGEQLPPA